MSASIGRATGPWVIRSPKLTAASAVSAARACELTTTATRSPRGSGWCTSSWAMSNIWCMFSARMTPACPSIASNASAGTPGRPGVPCPGGPP